MPFRAKLKLPGRWLPLSVEPTATTPPTGLMQRPTSHERRSRAFSRNPRSGATVQSLLRGRFLAWEKAQLFLKTRTKREGGFVCRRCRLNQRDPRIEEVTHGPRGFSSRQELRIGPERCVQTLADPLGEQWRTVGFLEKLRVTFFEALADDFRTVAAGEDNLEVRFALAQMRGQMRTGHAFGHDHVGQQQINLTV